ncbi:MAG: hypothetical protein ACXVO9_12615, partial [Bacteroidia bacterium]
PSDLEVKQRIGTCYLNVHDDKAKAIPYLEYCYKQGKYKSPLLLQLAQAYHFDYKFPEAISFYNKYREKVSSKEALLVDHYLETCENAKALMKKPVNVAFENLGKEINTRFADYYPFVTSDQSTLFFTSRRDENTGKLIDYNGYYTSDIYFSKVKHGEWTKAKKMPPTINTAEDEQCVGISGDGNSIIIYMENPENPGDLIHAEISKSKAFNRPVPFNNPVNTDQSELEGCYSMGADVLYFTSYRSGGVGESDIYITKRLPNGEWGIPQNLGPTINTPYKEAFPVVSLDGQTLYFSSQGHTSIGGYDIFRSKWNEAQQKWEKPVNIGYPVNTTDDDMMFSIAGNQRDGYISAVRKEGFGDLDIYKIIFKDAEKPLTALRGVINADSTQKRPPATITITDLKTNDALETKDINPATGKYIFIVEPGKYRIEIEAEGYVNLSEDITVYDKSDFVGELEKNFKLRSKNSSVPSNPNNSTVPKK